MPVLDSVLKGAESPFGEQCHVSADYVLNVVKHKSKRKRKKKNRGDFCYICTKAVR